MYQWSLLSFQTSFMFNFALGAWNSGFQLENPAVMMGCQICVINPEGWH